MKNQIRTQRFYYKSRILSAHISVLTVLFSLGLLITATQNTAQSLDDYMIIAAENNPKLKASFLEYQAALERVPQVGALPDPQLSFNFFVMPMERHMGNQIGAVSIMQMFPWFGTLSAAEDEMTYRAKAKFEVFNEFKSNLFYDLKVHWYTLHFLEKEIDITRENIELLQAIEEIIITRFRGGGIGEIDPDIMDRFFRLIRDELDLFKSSEPQVQVMKTSISSETTNYSLELKSQSSGSSMIDVLRLQMEINELENHLLLLEDNKVPLKAAFNKLLNRSHDEFIDLNDSITVAQLPVSLADLPDSIKSNNPMLKMLEREEAVFLAQGIKNRKMGMPKIGAGLQYEVFKKRESSESAMNGRNMIMPMVTISIPIWRKKYNSSIREAEIMRESVIEKKIDTENQLMVGYEEVLRSFRDAERRAELFKNQTLLAGQALNLLIVQYSTSGNDFEEVLRMQQKLLDYRLKQLEALVDGNIAVAMMEQLMGR